MRTQTGDQSPLDWRAFVLLLLTFPLFHVVNDLFRNHRELLAWLPEWRPMYFAAIVLPFGTVLPALALGWLIRSHGGDRRAFGATLGLRDLLLGLLGLVLGGVVIYFQAWRTLPAEQQQLTTVLHYFNWLLFPSIAESLVFIGVVFHVVELWARRLWPWRGAGVVGAVVAIILSSLAFGPFHYSYPTPWNTWEFVRTMFFVWLIVASFYALTRSMVAALMLHTVMAMTGFLRNQLQLDGPELLALTQNLIAIVTVVAIIGFAASPRRTVTRRQPA